MISNKIKNHNAFKVDFESYLTALDDIYCSCDYIESQEQFADRTANVNGVWLLEQARKQGALPSDIWYSLDESQRTRVLDSMLNSTDYVDEGHG